MINEFLPIGLQKLNEMNLTPFTLEYPKTHSGCDELINIVYKSAYEKGRKEDRNYIKEKFPDIYKELCKAELIECMKNTPHF